MARGFRFGGAGGEAAPEPAPIALVPTMTSNTTPSGVAFASTESSSNYQAWKAFNNNTSDTPWQSATADTDAWVGYQFVTPVVAKSLTYTINGDKPITLTVQASNDNTTWTNVSSTVSIPGTGTGVVDGTIGMPSNKTAYTSYRLKFTSNASSTIGCIVREMQFYGYRIGYPQYIIKDGEFISGSMSWDYNISGSTGTTNPVSIVNKDGYIEIKKNFGYSWAESRASAYVENIGISIANGDTIHLKARVLTTEEFGSGGNFIIGSVNTKSTSRTYSGSASLNIAEVITDFAYQNTLNNPSAIVLPQFNKLTSGSGKTGTITIEVYDLYVI